MKIFGAGLAGLMAGCAFQSAMIYEAKSESQIGHKALLRFRSPSVGDAVGIPFRKVLVRKNIWSDGVMLDRANVQEANLYAQKVVGRLVGRSIWNLDAVERWVAPDDLIPQLIERCQGRIRWNWTVTADEIVAGDEPVISTLPMNVMARFLLGDRDKPEFNYAPIVVQRFRIPNADVYQTVYFPFPLTSVYRVSITGDVMIAEYVAGIDNYDIFTPFGISSKDVEPLGSPTQQLFGKILPIDENWRQSFIFNLTHNSNIYSLGRFATWRNILLDDVLHDIDVLKRLMKSSAYDRLRAVVK